MKKRRQLLLRFRNVTQEEIDDLHNPTPGSTPEFENAPAPMVLLAHQLRDLTAALVLVERELARRRLGRTLH